jgi:hypothetical protein
VNNRVKAVALVCVVLLLGFAFCSLVSFDGDGDVVSGSALPWWPGIPDVVTAVENVTWDFYVVGAYNTTSPSFTPAPQPPGFTFTVVDGGQAMGHTGTGPGPVTGGFDFGTLWEYAGREYLSGWGWVEINITNNLGQDVVITNLTAEVTNGTITEEWVFIDVYEACIPPDPGIPEYCLDIARMGNFTFVNFQSFDPYADEVDYYAGTATPTYDYGFEFHDTRVMEDPLNPQLNPWTEMPTGPATLVGPDSGSDAAVTGHVAPILLRAGETLNEFFGPGIFGNATVPTKIWGTITLTLTYGKVVTPSPLDVVDVSIYSFYCDEIVTWAYNNWTVQVNVTVRNTGTNPISNISVSVYGFERMRGNLTHWSGGTWGQIGTTQTITGLDGGAYTTLTFSWELTCAPTYGPAPAKAIAVSVYNTTHIYYDELRGQVRIRLWGDVNDNGRVTLNDVAILDLIYSGIIPGPPYVDPTTGRELYPDVNGDCYVTLADIGKLDLIYSGIIPRLPACPP